MGHVRNDRAKKPRPDLRTETGNPQPPLIGPSNPQKCFKKNEKIEPLTLSGLQSKVIVKFQIFFNKLWH